ncbi:MAG: DUF624 domain-containing protein [Lachnospiraceae bacterium]|nr:DUF624 domain-containing protein [Lachnospiraceae bacterium]
MAGNFFGADGPLNKFADVFVGVFVTGLLTVILCVPVITAGPALTSGYYTMTKVVRHHEGYMLKSYFKSFLLNIRVSLPSWILYLAAIAVLIFDMYYMDMTSGAFSIAISGALIAIAAILFMNICFFYIELSRFNMKGFELFKFSMLTMFRHFPSALLVGAMIAGAFYLGYRTLWGIFIFPGLALYGSTFIMERVLLKYMPEPEEGSEEAEKWYYK